MISKDSLILRDFIKRISMLTNNKHFIKGAILQAETEDDLQHIIDYIDNNKDVDYADVMFEMARRNGLKRVKPWQQ